MKRSSMVVTGIAILLVGIAAVLSNCGGGGGGGGPQLQAPAYNLTGNWKETQTYASNSCGIPATEFPQEIVFWSFSQQQGSNTVDATDTSTNRTANLTLSGSTLTYSAPMDPADTGGFCTSASQSFSVTFTSASYGSGTSTISCNKTTGGSCTVTFNAKIEKQSGGASGGFFSYYTINENGGTVSPWGDGTSSHRPAVAVKFTPTVYPVTITSADIYVVNTTGSEKMFNLRGFSGVLSSETDLFSAVQNQSIPNTGTSCFKKTVNIPATIISSGSFYIAVEWITKPLVSVSGNNSFYLCVDGQLNFANTNYWRFTGTEWQTSESMIAQPPGDFGILVNY